MMTTQEITQLLKENEGALFSHFNEKGVAYWELKPEGKWSAGQHVIHLVQSTRPLLKALKLPNFLLKWKFGTSNRPSRTYDEVIKRYNEKLELVVPGILSPFSRSMPDSPRSEAQKWMNELSDLNTRINNITLKCSDDTLDNVILPHPLMGKMTLREILMWNAYHTSHHIHVLTQKYK